VDLVLDDARLSPLDAASRAASARSAPGREGAAALAADLVRFIGDRSGRRRTTPGRPT
jgi:hypothetical protein